MSIIIPLFKNRITDRLTLLKTNYKLISYISSAWWIRIWSGSSF